MNHTFSMGKLFFSLVSLFMLRLFDFASAQDSPQGWTPEVMSQFKRVGGTALSVDGGLIAYTVSEPVMDEKRSEYLTHIWVVSADGRTNRQFTRGEKSCTNPAFSPDGQYLSFLSSRGADGKNQIWLLPLQGGEAELLTEVKAGVSAYAWSPDGKRIAFIAQNPETAEEEQNRKGKRDMRVLDADYRYAHLYTVALDNSGPDRAVQRVTSGLFHVTGFDWSPDGKTLAFEHRINPKVNEWPTSDISTVPADSGRVTPLVTFSGADLSPLFSPDGKWLACISDGGNPKWACAMDIYIIPAKGGEAKKLAETADRRPQIVSWSANSRNIYYSETDHTHRRLFLLPTNGKPPLVVTPGAGNFTHISISKNGRRIALIHQTPELAPNVYTASTRKFSFTKLTDVNADFPKFPMGRTEVIKWQSKNGLEIEGLLTYPVRYVLDRLTPLILSVHGGPAGVYTQTYTARSSIYPTQAFAQEGYAVLRPNPRGSSGYGRDFRFANYNNWGFGDYEDLIAGVNKVMQMGVAHPDSLCVMGWSYGGYMTSVIVTKSNRFKVASIGAGVTNLFSFSGTADIPGFLPDYFGGEPWDRLDTYIKHSAMFQVKGVKTPTQIIHGEDDRRVPLSQGLEFYNALKRQGCATEMIVYPRTPHGPREPKFIQDIGERIIAWFNLHLGRRKRREPVVVK